MLELIIVIWPAILALFVYRRTYREFDWKKASVYGLGYTAVVNFCILAGLKLIGMQRSEEHTSELQSQR